ncbi:MAG: BolA family protein, partial [Burkholderiales bacterium]
TIVSPRFAGVSRITRHRMVYAALGPLMQGPIHALAIQAFAPDER